MAISADEAIQVLRMIQSRLSDTPLSIFSGRAIEEAYRETEPRRQLIQYLDGLAELLSAEAASAVPLILAKLNEFVSTVDGAPIDGILIHSTEARQAITGTSRTILIEDARLSAVAVGFGVLRDQIRQDLDGPATGDA